MTADVISGYIKMYLSTIGVTVADEGLESIEKELLKVIELSRSLDDILSEEIEPAISFRMVKHEEE